MNKVIFICSPENLSHALKTFGQKVATLLISEGDRNIFQTLIKEKAHPIEVVANERSLLEENLAHSLIGRERIIFVTSNWGQQQTMRFLAIKNNYTIAQ